MYVFAVSSGIACLDCAAVIREKFGCRYVVSQTGWTPIPLKDLPDSNPIYVVSNLEHAWILRSCTVAELRDTVNVTVPKEVLAWMKKVCNG